MFNISVKSFQLLISIAADEKAHFNPKAGALLTVMGATNVVVYKGITLMARASERSGVILTDLVTKSKGRALVEICREKQACDI